MTTNAPKSGAHSEHEPTSEATTPASTRRCPVCESGDVVPFLRRTEVPVHQNLLASSVDDARSVQVGELTMCACARCGFVFNGSFDGALMSYDARYDNTQTCSPEFEEYVNRLIHHLVNERNVRDCTVVEVGCGKGDFIRRLVGFPGANITGVGFDPTYVGPESQFDGRLQFRRTFYDEYASSIPADVVVCRHVIEHVPAPVELLRAVQRAVAHRPNALICFETPSVAWILERRVLWDFFYEHCSIFTPASLTTAFERAGLQVSSVMPVFGDQYLWLEASLSPIPPRVTYQPGDIIKLARECGDAERTVRAHWRETLDRIRRDAPVNKRIGVWGAGAKGVTFANLVDHDARLIDCFVEVNPRKQRKFIPGSGHAVIAPEQIDEAGLGAVIALNPNYVSEMRELLRSNGSAASVVDLMAETT